MPRFVSVLVNGGKAFRQEAAQSFADRSAGMHALVAHLAALAPAPRAVLFPAGYFCAPTATGARAMGDAVARSLAATSPQFDLVWGVDGWTPQSKAALERGPDGYPYFVFALARGGREPTRVRQLATQSSEAEFADRHWNGRPPTCCRDIGLLVCGESRGDVLLRRIEAARPSLMFVPAHSTVNLMTDPDSWRARRFSWHLRLDEFARRTGIPVVLAEHTRSPERHDYAWGARSVEQAELPGDLSALFTVKLVEV